MKLSRLFLLILVIVVLIVMSDLIYIYTNEPYQFGRIFLFFALREARKGKLDEAMRNLDMGAPRSSDFKIKTNLTNISEETRNEIFQYLRQNLPNAFDENTAPVISNIYYNLGLISYKNNSHQEANSLFSIPILLRFAARKGEKAD